MTPAELLAELAATGIEVTLAGADLEVTGARASLTPAVLERLQGAKPALRDHLASPEAAHPEFAAAIRSGVLVFCLRCGHYRGPARKALGHCRVLRTEAAPDVPFDCPSFTPLATPAAPASDTDVFP